MMVWTAVGVAGPTIVYQIPKDVPPIPRDPPYFAVFRAGQIIIEISHRRVKHYHSFYLLILPISSLCYDCK